MRAGVLAGLRPGWSRVVAAGMAGALAAGLGWAAGAGTGRTALLAVAVVALGLLVRTGEPRETRWPDPPARRTRPGWHAVASTQRALEAARSDRDDRRSLAARLDALDAGGRDPRTDAARAAVGLPVPSTRRPS